MCRVFTRRVAILLGRSSSSFDQRRVSATEHGVDSFALLRDVPTIRKTQVNRELSLSRWLTVPEIVLTVRLSSPRRTGRRFAGENRIYRSIPFRPQRGGAGYPSDSKRRTSRYFDRRKILQIGYPRWRRSGGKFTGHPVQLPSTKASHLRQR